MNTENGNGTKVSWQVLTVIVFCVITAVGATWTIGEIIDDLQDTDAQHSTRLTTLEHMSSTPASLVKYENRITVLEEAVKRLEAREVL